MDTGKSDHLWAHISSSSESELSAILARNHEITSYYYSIEDWMIPLVLRYGSPDWIMTTDRYILESEEPIGPL
ncbi:MAG: hypothetical protein IPH45_19230 [Bacteroidales bacterium]|nr:hypothetical protein [Bacteroidales bacterium]